MQLPSSALDLRRSSRPKVPTIDRKRPVHWSELRNMARSAAQYRASLQREDRPTPAMQFGTLVHAVVLGGTFLMWPGDRRGKAWEEFRDANAGTSIFTATEVERAKAVAASVCKHKAAWAIVREARHEVPAAWTFAGRLCATRGIDLLSMTSLDELKTAPDARPEKFHWHAKSMGYIGQLAFYEPAAISMGFRPETFRIIAAETKPPYDVVVHRITPNAMDKARRTVRALMERLLVCEENDVWPGYSDAEVDLDDDPAQEFTFGDEEDV